MRVLPVGEVVRSGCGSRSGEERAGDLQVLVEHLDEGSAAVLLDERVEGGVEEREQQPQQQPGPERLEVVPLTLEDESGELLDERLEPLVCGGEHARVAGERPPPELDRL